MGLAGGMSRRTVLAGAGALASALVGFTAFSEPLPRVHPIRLTATTDPDLIEANPRYADVPWDPGSGVRPLRSAADRWWLIGSSTAEFASPHLAALAARHGVVLHQDAKAGETDAQISARMGLAPGRLTFPADTIPSGTGRVWGPAAPLITRSSLSYEGRVEGTGVTGRLGWDRSRRIPSFERLDDGGQVRVAEGARFFPTLSPSHRADVALFLGGGKNSVTVAGVSAENIVAGWREQHAWLVPKNPWFLRQGFFPNTASDPRGSVRANIDAVNDWGRSTLGARFLDIAGWLRSPAVWERVGVRPTRADLAEQRVGNLPPSLADRGGIHLSDAAASAWVHTVVEPRLLALGWV